jgi:hypothetical protein
MVSKECFESRAGLCVCIGLVYSDSFQRISLRKSWEKCGRSKYLPPTVLCARRSSRAACSVALVLCGGIGCRHSIVVTLAAQPLGVPHAERLRFCPRHLQCTSVARSQRTTRSPPGFLRLLFVAKNKQNALPNEALLSKPRMLRQTEGLKCA